VTNRRRPSSSEVRAAAIGAAAAALVLVVMLGAQHLRQGWPFSLHYDAPPDAQATAARPAPTALAHDAGEAHGRAEVELDAAAMATAGLQVERARVETITRTVRAIANVVPDERRISHVHTRVSGWIEQLHVAATGDSVRAGQALATIFSQDLYASQTEYLAALARTGEGPRSAVAEGARARLRVFGMTEAEIGEIERSGEPRRLVTVTAPFEGVVLRRGVSVGTAVDPSTPLFTIADLSVIWIIAELPESDSAAIGLGMPAVLDFGGSGLESFEAEVDFLYPTLSERTRTLRVRFIVPNPRGTLRPGIYGSALFLTPPRDALTVPRDAVVETSGTQHVFVATGQGRFEPRPVQLGVRLPERIEILDGLTEGDAIVTSGVFLLDSESRLRSVGGSGIGHAGHGDARAPEEVPASESVLHTGH
jgi:membrane fusion protein, copper/silver efflux system